LFVSRLQLQEGRMNTMIRRLDSVRETLASEQRELVNAQDGVKSAESDLASGLAGISREELVRLVAGRKRQMEERRATVARLTAEETQLSADLATEQGRWTDINQRLDELERTLSRR
jgi:hypothetical protein